MKNKILKTLIVIFAVSITAFTLTACEEPHEHSYSQVVTPPTCEDQGFTTNTCECGDVVVDNYVNALGHTFTNYISDNNATCTTNCTETATCDNCTATDTKEIADSKLPHSFTNYVSDNNATCTVNGTETATCDNCDATDTKEIADSKLPHSFTNYVSDNNATYDNDGTKTAACDREGCEVTDTVNDDGTKLESHISFNTLSLEGLNAYGVVSNQTDEFNFNTEVTINGYVDYVVSYDKYGSQQVLTKIVPLYTGNNTFYVFEMQGTNITKTYEVTLRRRPMHNVYFNTLGSYVKSQSIEEDSLATEPTIIPTRDGYTFMGWDYDFTAPVTSAVTVDAIWQINQYTVTIKYGNGEEDKVITQNYNTAINETLPGTLERSGYTFNGWDKEIPTTMPANNTTITAKWLAIFNCSNGKITGLTSHGKTLSEIIIPSEIGGTRITSIGYEAFYDCDSLTSVVIPDSVTSIGSFAFEGCSSLTSVVIGDSVTSIGESAFYYCYKLFEVINNSPHITIKKGSSDNGYLGYYALSVFNSGDTYINRFTTDSNGYVIYTEGEDKILVNYVGEQTELTLPNDITKIYQRVFYDNNKITSVVIPDSVTSIGDRAFYGCPIQKATMPAIAISHIPQSVLKEVIITSGESIGYEAFYDCDSLTSVVIPDSVTSIGGAAFRDCDSLTSVVIPDSVTSIGGCAFDCCSSLTSVVIGNSVTSIGNAAFYNCTSLTSVVIPDSVRSIDYRAFYYCTSLTSVTIGNGVTSIPKEAFYYCNSLTSVVIPDSVTSIGEDAFYSFGSLTKVNYLGTIDEWVQIEFASASSNPLCKNLHIDDVLVTEVVLTTATKISNYAFYNYTSLTSVVIPDSVTSIGNWAFYGCPIQKATMPAIAISHIPQSVLKEVIITSGERIGSSAFDHCTSLTSIVIPDSVTSIGGAAFRDCDSLTSIVIPDSVTSIGNWAFSGCSSLQSITLPFVGNTLNGTTDTHFGYIFGASSYFYNDYYVPTSLNTVVITGGKIFGYAFYYCDSLTSVVIGNSVTSIGNAAFYSCTSLTSVVIPDSVTSIGDYTFYCCSSLTSVVIPDSVTSIGEDAFYGCGSLTKVNYLGTIDEWVQIEFDYYSSNPLRNAKNLHIDDVLVTEVVLTTATKISNYAFYNCTSLTSVEIGNSVTSIGDRAFYNCDLLTSIVIGNSVTSIGDYAFKHCDSLTSIKYRGTKEEWLDISKGYDWNYNNTGYYTIIYNYDGE